MRAQGFVVCMLDGAVRWPWSADFTLMSFARPDKPHPSSSQKSLDPDDPDPISKVGGEGGYMHKKIVGLNM